MDTQTHCILHKRLAGLGLDEHRIRQFFTPMTSAIYDIVGLETTLSIIQHVGGRQIYLAKNPSERSPLVRAAGREGAAKIAAFLGADQKIVIPNPFSSRVLLRLEGMRLLEGGASYGDVAVTLGVSRNAVRDWCQKLPAPRPPAEKPRDIAMRLFSAGKSLQEVREIVGVKSATARKWQLQWECMQ